MKDIKVCGMTNSNPEYKEPPVYRARRRARQKGSEWNNAGFDSRFEWTVSTGLSVAKASYKCQPPPLKWVKECSYTPDFLIKTRSGKTFYVEAKGYFTSEDR